MRNVRNENGVTMMILIIMIIIMIMLTTVGIYTGIDSYKSMKVQAYVAQMKVIKEKINIIKEEYEFWDEYNGTNINDYIADRYHDKNVVMISTYPDADDTKIKFKDILENGKTKLKGSDLVLSNYYYFSAADLEEILGLKNLDLNVIINFNTGTLVSKEPCEIVTIFGKTETCYVLQEVINIQNLIFTEGSDVEEELTKELQIRKVEMVINNVDKTEIHITFNRELKNLLEFNVVKNINDVETPITDLAAAEITYEGGTNFDVLKITLDEKNIGEYKFIIKDKLSETDTSVVETEFIEIQKVNSPKIIEGMKPVIWEGTAEKTVTVDDISWYNYSSSAKNWANVKMPDDSYYVWIPRFAYKLETSSISIIFLKGDSNKSFDGKELPTGYIVHPAFSYLKSDVLESEALEGFWVAKFENTVSSNEIHDTDATAVEFLLKSIPGVNYDTDKEIGLNEALSYAREIEINLDAYKFDYDPYTVPKDPAALENAIENTVGDEAGSKKDNYTRPNVSTDLEIENGNPDIDTHLIKNTEWGALAYLTYSEYGTGYSNLRTTINNFTGGVNGFKKDPELSTTGTVYGVYDLCNTNYEYIAAATKSFANNKTALNKILDGREDAPYFTAYPNAINGRIIQGDALTEINSLDYSYIIKNWLSSTSYYMTTSEGILVRGRKNLFDYFGGDYADKSFGIRVVWYVF